MSNAQTKLNYWQQIKNKCNQINWDYHLPLNVINALAVCVLFIFIHHKGNVYPANNLKENPKDDPRLIAKFESLKQDINSFKIKNFQEEDLIRVGANKIKDFEKALNNIESNVTTIENLRNVLIVKNKLADLRKNAFPKFRALYSKTIGLNKNLIIKNSRTTASISSENATKDVLRIYNKNFEDNPEIKNILKSLRDDLLLLDFRKIAFYENTKYKTKRNGLFDLPDYYNATP